METLATVKKDQHISVVQTAFKDFLNGNIPGIIEACTDDIVWASYANPGIPFGTSFRGKKGVEEFFNTLAGSVDYKEFQPKEYFADKDHVFVKGYHEATVRSTGKTFGHDFLMEFSLQDGKIASFFAFVDTRDQAQAFSS